MKRLKPEDRKRSIFEAMLPLAEAHGYNNVTRDMVGQSLGITGNAVQHHFGTMEAMREGFIEFAIRNEILPIVAQAIAAGNKKALTAPKELRCKALRSLM